MKSIIFYASFLLSLCGFSQENPVEIPFYKVVYDATINSQPVYKGYLLLGKQKSQYYEKSTLDEVIRKEHSPTENNSDVDNWVEKKEFTIIPQFTEHNIIDYKEGKIISMEFVPLKKSYYEEPLPAMNWKVTQESKMIDSLLCVKATLNYRCNDFEVWFAPSIPLKHGPWKLRGLPGLIVEAYDLQKMKYYRLSSLSPIDRKTYSKNLLMPKSKVEPMKKYLLDKKNAERMFTKRKMADCLGCEQTTSKVTIITYECFEEEKEQ